MNGMRGKSSLVLLRNSVWLLDHIFIEQPYLPWESFVDALSIVSMYEINMHTYIMYMYTYVNKSEYHQ